MYPEEKMRSQVIGIILGSMALGVLLGYPFGGIMYAFSGKSAPFYIIAILVFIIFGNFFVWSFELSKITLSNTWYYGTAFRTFPNNITILFCKICIFVALQMIYMNLQCTKHEVAFKEENYTHLLSDPIIAKIFTAILISTIAMATLEPCLPIWLMETLKPEVNYNFYRSNYLINNVIGGN